MDGEEREAWGLVRRVDWGGGLILCAMGMSLPWSLLEHTPQTRSRWLLVGVTEGRGGEEGYRSLPGSPKLFI